MSKLNRDKIKKMILQEMKMLGMADMAPMGVMGLSGASDHHMRDKMPGCGDDMDEELFPMHTSHSTPMMGSGAGQVSREDCCAAVMCLVECCSCPVTKAALMECCQDIMAGDYDH